MNNSAFLSDILNDNIEYKTKFETNFITGEETSLIKTKFDDKKTNSVENNEYVKNNEYSIKSATVRNWSIKFK